MVVEPGESEGASAVDPVETPAIEYAKPLTPDLHMASGITRGDIAALAVRLLGIYIIVIALPVLGYALESFFTPMKLRDVMQFYVLYDATLIAVGTFMVIKAAMIGGWLLPKAAMNTHLRPAAGTPQELQAVAFSVVGVTLTVFAFPGLAAVFAEYASGSHDPIYSLIKPGVEFAVGLLLFFRSKRLARYWQGLPAASSVRSDDDPGPL